MDVGMVLGVTGLLATVVFGVGSIYLVIRHRYPGEISFVREEAIGLFQSIVQNLPELAVLHQGKPVSHGLVLLKACILNNGAIDIASSMVRVPVGVDLPEGYRWLTAKIVSQSEGLDATIRLHEQRVEFTADIFRRGEFIRWEALAEVAQPEASVASNDTDAGHQLTKVLGPSHRIADTGKIRTVDLQAARYRTRLQRPLIFAGVGIVLTLVLSGAILLKGWPGRIDYNMRRPDGSTTHLRATPRLDGSIRLSGVDNQYTETIQLSQLRARTDLEPIVVPDKQIKWMIVATLVIYVLAPMGYLGFRLFERRKLRRLLQQIGAQISAEAAP